MRRLGFVRYKQRNPDGTWDYRGWGLQIGRFVLRFNPQLAYRQIAFEWGRPRYRIIPARKPSQPGGG